jgi:tetratricopeptide (TPR) repeat protein
MKTIPKRRCAKLVWSALALSVAVGGCAGRDPSRLRSEDVDVRLDRLLGAYDLRTAEGGTCLERLGTNPPIRDCDRLRQEVERLNLEFPAQPRLLMTSAVLAWNGGDAIRAQQYLDSLLTLRPRSPDAAVLRARIAMQEGNLGRADRLLSQQALLTPDHAEVRETLAAVRFLQKRYDDAARELDTAARLGSPAWRIAYHRGLLAEVTQRPLEAAAFYEAALAENPAFVAARARLEGLGAR